MATERTLGERAAHFSADVPRFRAAVQSCQQLATNAREAGQTGRSARFEIENTEALLRAQIIALETLTAEMFRESPAEATQLTSDLEVFRLLLLETTELRGRLNDTPNTPAEGSR